MLQRVAQHSGQWDARAAAWDRLWERVGRTGLRRVWESASQGERAKLGYRKGLQALPARSNSDNIRAGQQRGAAGRARPSAAGSAR